MAVFKRCGALVCCFLAVVLLLGPGRAQAASTQEIQEQIDQLKEQQAQLKEQSELLESQLADNLEQMKQVVAQKDTIDQQIVLLYAQSENLNSQIMAYALLVADRQDALDITQQHYEELERAYRERVRIMEEQGSISYWSVIFKASSFADLLDRLQMVNEIAAADRQRLAELEEAAEAVALEKQALEQAKGDLELTREELALTLQSMQSKRAESDALLQQLVAQGEEFQALLSESELLQDELMESLAQKQVELDEAAYKEWLESYVPPAVQPGETPPSVQVPESEDDWLTPVPYYTLTSAFGMRLHPILGYYRLHNGVDLACAAMTPIYASRSGIVITAAYQADGAGNYVQLDHADGYRSIYMHMTYYTVSEGQYVAAGQVIGFVGNTGLSKGNHLHFGISYNGTYVNPMEYIG